MAVNKPNLFWDNVPKPELFGTRKLAIVAMGASYRDYLNHNFHKEEEGNVADDIWAVNSAAFTFKHDLAIMMDDMKALEGNPKRKPYTDRIKRELDTPILTSRKYLDYPTTIEYPLTDIINKFQFKYLNGSVAYALVYALYLGYKNIILYGCDYMYDQKPGLFEKGRGCVEFWIAYGTLKCDAHIMIARTSTLMDSNSFRFYGYREQPVFRGVNNPDGTVTLALLGYGDPKQFEEKVSKEALKQKIVENLVPPPEGTVIPDGNSDGR